ncbi:asparagine synthase (glutamine-hydrolyzing) [Candidatus Wolfebacteria bacterium]|nr:asparagine synthase (glutamine-hydrolyzing) [Candidatus Wolfebacteria bacterium]
MCGIAGIYYKNGKIAGLKEAVQKMNESQFHRGPDDEGIFIDEQNGIVLGHRRLSILDLSAAGQQPMIWHRDDGGEIAVVFNGEIYNFLELKKDLRSKGYQFSTQTDTEVILALYNEYGEKSFGMLRGMFAFALWDNRNKKMFLVKDRYGIKPLYYYSDNGKLVFASTVKAIIESREVPIQKNSNAYIGFLLFGSVLLPMTTYKDIFGLSAGYYLEINADGEKKLVKYYDALEAFQKKSKDNFKEAKIKIRSLLDESIRLHLISDALLGVFLSGGLDSSAIAALAAKAKSEKIKTLSIIFDEKEFSEQKYQQMVAEKINSDHREIKITKKDFFDSFDEIFEAMDQPTIDGINTFFISRAAKEAGLKTVLSGLGSDEIFMGYSSFKKASFLRKIQKLPEILKLPLRFFSLFGGRWSRLSYLENNTPLNFYLAIKGLFTPRETAGILNISVKEVNDFIDELTKLTNLQTYKLNNLDPADLLSYLELKFYLQNQLLKDTDFMSMYHSVEVRVPFLDHLLVEYLSSLAPEIKLGRSVNKALLVEATRDLLPQEIFNRSKMGFTFPFEKWLSSNVKGQMSDAKTHWSRHWAKEVLEKWK